MKEQQITGCLVFQKDQTYYNVSVDIVKKISCYDIVVDPQIKDQPSEPQIDEPAEPKIDKVTEKQVTASSDKQTRPGKNNVKTKAVK